MKKFLGVILGTALILGACGGEVNEESAPADNDNQAAEETGADGTQDLANGEQLYQNSCIACHGGDLEGGSGPGLAGLSYDDVLYAIETGPGSMPADLVTGTDAEDVSAWVANH